MNFQGLKESIVKSIAAGNKSDRIDCSGVGCYGSNKWEAEHESGRVRNVFVFVTGSLDIRTATGHDAQYNISKAKGIEKVVWFKTFDVVMDAVKTLTILKEYDEDGLSSFVQRDNPSFKNLVEDSP